MTQGISCRDLCCKHHQAENVCGTTAVIGPGAKCQSFEKGLAYDLRLVLAALLDKNFIDTAELSAEMRIGMYCVMKIYHLGFDTMEWGLCRMYALKAAEDGPMLKTADIIALPMDEAAVKELEGELEAGSLTGRVPDQPSPKKKSQPFGWLSPTGDFTEGEFGEHDDAAREIIQKRGFGTEFHDWRDQHQGTCRDFLSEVKGYCLIHNPCGTGDYLVSHVKPLTKKQRDFMYGYFMDMGDRFKAEQFAADQ